MPPSNCLSLFPMPRAQKHMAPTHYIYTSLPHGLSLQRVARAHIKHLRDCQSPRTAAGLIMRGQSNESTTSVLHSSPSSIALLQERFRQLQRTKAMREERELQRVVLAPAEVDLQPARWFFHPDLVRPSRPLQGQQPLGLGVADGGDRRAFQPGGRPAAQSSKCCNDNVEVDTSLHL